MLIRAVFLIFGIFALSSAQKNALCTFPTYLRGKWVMMPEDKSMDDTGHYVIVRKDTIQIDLIDNVNNTLVTKSSEMYCKEVDGYNLLLQRRKNIRRERVFRDRSDILATLDDTELIDRYRFPRDVIIDIINDVSPLISRPTSRTHSIPANLQVLITLRYLAKADFFSEVGDLHGVSKPSVSRILHNVCAAINTKMDNIKFPQDVNDLRRIKSEFYNIANFPNCVGAIDGTLIPIKGMTGNEEHAYVCRKNFHALNIQAVVDAKMRFINLNARFPGATHDSYILSQSGLPETVLGLSGGGWLLGDSGYPLKEWLMTPFISPSNQQEERYNNAHCRTRTVIERAFGVLKSRFRSPDETNKYLCLQFMQIMDTHYQYDLRRTNYADIGQEYFDPSVATNASLADTCILTQNRPIPLRRKSPGCNFPDMIHGNWAYSGSEYEDLTFTKDYLTVNVTGGEPVEFKCERMDHPPSQKQHYVALRSTGIKKVNGLDKDGVLCLRINMLPEGKISLQRLNSGTDANKTIKIISRAEPIYLHETCDLIDTNPEAFSITKV